MEYLSCRDDARREAVRRHVGRPNLNGLDYLEVEAGEKTLTVYFLGKLPAALRVDREELPQYLRIEGGRRIRDIKVLDVDPHQVSEPDRDDHLTVHLDRSGDFSTYTLRLVNVPGIDPRYDHIDFNFKIDCPNELDCAPADDCPPPVRLEPEINYLAKDYASFRQLILDRLALVIPGWRERHVPDIGIALVEVLAYVGDYLSYYQDAVATEAYLDTARRRISVRRHARLVDYIIHEGANARTWVSIETNSDLELDPETSHFITGLGDSVFASQSVLDDDDIAQLTPADSYEVFEPLVADKTQLIPLYEAHSEIHFYTWGSRECCLARGATSATLEDTWVYAGDTGAETQAAYTQETGTPDTYRQAAPPQQQFHQQQQQHQPQQHEPQQQYQPQPAPPDPAQFERKLKLKVGDVLIFEELLGPKTGAPADADPSHRHAVRLTRVEAGEDALFKRQVEANGGQVWLPVPVVEIEWDALDALPFPLCVSAIGRAPECAYLEEVSVARGNVILVDHGRTRRAEDLGNVELQSTEAECWCVGEPGEVTFTAQRFEPRLRYTPLTHSEPLSQSLPAARTLWQDARKALPQISLYSIPPTAKVDPNTGKLLPLYEWDALSDPAPLIAKLADPQLRRGFPLSRRTRSLLSKHDANAPPTDELSRAVVADLRAALGVWKPRPDLLASGGDDLHFVVEIDDDGDAHLRFGDGELGEQPRAGAAFRATYRTGNGTSGNVGAESILHLVLSGTTLSGVALRVRNPLPATGGIEPEPLDEARLAAPTSFRKQLVRAINAADYAQLTEREFKREVQRAAASLVWTGSWNEASVAVDALGVEPDDAGVEDLLQQIGGMLHRYRRMGHDVAVKRARRVPLEIAFDICVRDGHLRGHVEAALREAFSNRVLSGGKLGFFHPDNLTFGQHIYLSKLVAAAHAVAGVQSVQVTKLQRLFDAPNYEIKNGVLPLGAFEVAQLDNDPNYPEHGRMMFLLKGGR
jgi:hypothetical protein